MKYAVATGEPFDVILFYGTFDTFEDAQEWAEQEVSYTKSWWVISIDDPYEL